MCEPDASALSLDALGRIGRNRTARYLQLDAPTEPAMDAGDAPIAFPARRYAPESGSALTSHSMRADGDPSPMDARASRDTGSGSGYLPRVERKTERN